jgi:predicted homoserine dehydrogenase-like protein
LYEIDRRLEDREAEGNPIRIGLVGTGQMGREIVAQIGLMKGIEVSVAVDMTTERVQEVFRESQKKSDVVATTSVKDAEAAVTAGKRVATTEFRIATSLPQIDVVIDATGAVEMGALITLEAIEHKKHIVMMNVECDVTIGPILRRMAENAGVVYSLAAGDEPAAVLELYRFARALGFEIVAAGKGKNNPLDIYATPDALADEAKARDMSAKMLCEFVDGSKTAVEMAAVSNATGLVPDIRGMHGARASVDTLHRVFCPKEQGGILNRTGVVDFALGVHPGVFLVITTRNERIRSGLVQRDMGDGPNYLLFRPYHLCSIEVPLTAAQAVLYGESSGHPMKSLSSECIAVAKKDLKAGHKMDRIGEYCYRASIERADISREENLLPLGLAAGCVVKRDVKRDTALAFDMVEIVDESVVLQLRRIQDALEG